MNDEIKYIVVQAGGRGERMGYLTDNKPKALVSIESLPLLFHLFKLFPSALFIIIGDYKFDVLKRYLNLFAKVEYKLVYSGNEKGTCAGIKRALEYIPNMERFILTWCDIVLPDDYSVPFSNENYVGISADFVCRWKFENGEFVNEESNMFGVAGHFIFKNKTVLENVPLTGEFVKWLQTSKIPFKDFKLKGAKEFGTCESVSNLHVSKCRPFNSLLVSSDRVTKLPLDIKGRQLAENESAWYKKAISFSFEGIPHIYEYSPLVMEKINGRTIYECSDLSKEEKNSILKKIVIDLSKLHSYQKIAADHDSCVEAYITKTFERLQTVRELIPFSENEFIRINGKLCRNVFFYEDEFMERVTKLFPSEFCFIHGDCTFSNIMIDDDGKIFFIDPRGYFGKTLCLGDEAYDWAKLYYSLFSNYDAFNLKEFRLEIDSSNITISIKSNGWECLENEFFKLLPSNYTKQHMRMLIAIIWLSLTTYVWDDYDSICAAFYNGLLLLEEVL